MISELSSLPSQGGWFRESRKHIPGDPHPGVFQHKRTCAYPFGFLDVFFLAAGAAPEGLTALMTFAAIGEPRPVHASQPLRAGKLPLLPWVMSRNALLAAA